MLRDEASARLRMRLAVLCTHFAESWTTGCRWVRVDHPKWIVVVLAVVSYLLCGSMLTDCGRCRLGVIRLHTTNRRSPSPGPVPPGADTSQRWLVEPLL
jgi:hypothetical protein